MVMMVKVTLDRFNDVCFGIQIFRTLIVISFWKWALMTDLKEG